MREEEDSRDMKACNTVVFHRAFTAHLYCFNKVLSSLQTTDTPGKLSLCPLQAANCSRESLRCIIQVDSCDMKNDIPKLLSDHESYFLSLATNM